MDFIQWLLFHGHNNKQLIKVLVKYNVIGLRVILPWKKRNTSTDPALGRVDLVLLSSCCDFSLNKAYIGAKTERLPKYGCKAERGHKVTFRDPALG